MNEVDVIFHLLEQEEKTSSMVREAQIESDRRLSAARTAAEAAYSKQYEGERLDLEAAFTKKRAAVEAEFREKTADFQSRLEAQIQKPDAVNSYLDKLFFQKGNP